MSRHLGSFSSPLMMLLLQGDASFVVVDEALKKYKYVSKKRKNKIKTYHEPKRQQLASLGSRIVFPLPAISLLHVVHCGGGAK